MPLPTGTVTFMFTDIEGSTRLVQALGERYPPLLARHHALLRAAISGAGGVEVSTEGDAFFAAFDSAAAAIAAAVSAQRALAAEEWPADAPVRVRMGLHSGAGETLDQTYVGLDVHRAARIAAAAHGGQLLLSDATRALAGTLPAGLELRDLGEHRLKDLAAPERLFQVAIDGLADQFPPLRTLDARRGNLPAPPTSFLGREADVERVSALLGDSRLVTLTGPGGTGKTRLSIEVATRLAGGFPGGAWFVALEAVRDPALVLPEVAATLGVVEQPGQPIETALAARLAEQPTLLVIDNLEQVVAAGPALGRLIAAAPALRVLGSSREPLRVSGEQEYPVPPLADEPATLLFIERAQLITPGFMPAGATLEAVREIGRRLDGLPLAIELAAARIRVLTAEQIRDRLGESLRLLAGGARDM
ncbi:MAG TPA: adenylate/guanylate cyclase domain-containing protein, partial [Candidatus Limnocylindrales bacterium]